MRILVVAAALIPGLICAAPAWALDDTPTQTPFMNSINSRSEARADDGRAAAAHQAPQQPIRRAELDEPRRPVRMVATPATTAPAPLAPALAGRVIGLR